MQTRRRPLYVIAAAGASFITALFLLSMFFAFGISIHNSKAYSWNDSARGAGMTQLLFWHGQLHLYIDFGPLNWPAVPRRWHAGWFYAPGFRLDLQMTDRRVTKLGLDAFLAKGTNFALGLSGLYPTILSWILVWRIARKRVVPTGSCRSCGYNLTGNTSCVCPECGTATHRPS